ncbi:MAG: hypothetical protein Q8O30_03195 [Candidatus Omnitrophota bacterium]|nr:hypothetical protein [Candidatus Omnitrophota bacterium]
MYYPFRQWFLHRLLNFQFPIWNPYWGAGHEAVIWSTVPIDPYTIFELIIGPRYGYFYLIQCMALVLAGYYVFRKMKLEPWTAVTCSLLFFMSPLITYWYFEFINTNTFIAHMLTFLFIIKWLETAKWRYVLLTGWAFFLGMFGTKLEFWFFEFVFFTLLLITAFFIMKPKKSSMIFFAWLSILFAILAQSWQINILVNALNNSGRMLIPHSLGNLFSFELYKNLFLSMGDSELIPLILICFYAFTGLYNKNRYRWYFISISLAIFFLLGFWKFPFLALFLRSPVFFGALLAAILSFRLVSRKQLLSSWILFMLPAYYWCKPLANFDETYLIRIAPILFKGVWGFLVWLGCLDVPRNKISRLAYISILIILLLESQGQVILTHLFGLVWIPGRDNYLIDFLFVLIAAIGTMNNFKFKPLLLRLAPFVIIFSALNNLYYTLPTKPTRGYANPLLRSGLTYDPFKEVPDLKKIIEGRDYLPYRRVLDPDIEHQLPQNQGTFLLKQTNNAAFYGSMKPVRYSQLINFYKDGINPKDHIAGYPSTYSEKTISRLPKLDMKGFTNNKVYYFTVWTIPPLELELLKLLGVDCVITRNDNLLPPLIEKLKLRNVTKSGEFNIAELSDTLPRSFLVSNVTENNFEDFKKNMRPQIELKEPETVKASSVYFVKPATFIKYEPEYVEISVESLSGGYLVLTDVFHPYWSATVDEERVEIVPAFHAFRAVKVPAGMHKVKFFCKVPYFTLTVTLSLTLVTILLFTTFYLWRKDY